MRHSHRRLNWLIQFQLRPTVKSLTLAATDYAATFYADMDGDKVCRTFSSASSRAANCVSTAIMAQPPTRYSMKFMENDDLVSMDQEQRTAFMKEMQAKMAEMQKEHPEHQNDRVLIRERFKNINHGRLWVFRGIKQ